MSKFATIVLAAGLGKRTGSKDPKVLINTVEKRPLISYVLDSIKETSPAKVLIVVGYRKEQVIETVSSFSIKLPNLEFCVQEQQRGTGDAVKSTFESLKDFDAPVLILCGDMPLVSSKTLSSLIESHFNQSALLSLVSIKLDYENDFGRIIRDGCGKVIEIVEKKDCSPHQLQVKERNMGIYCVNSKFLYSALNRLDNKNAQSEFYLTDIIKIAVNDGIKINTVDCLNQVESLGVNDLGDLMLIDEELRKKAVLNWAKKGVRFLAPESVVIEAEAQISTGVVIGPAVQILGTSQIGENTIIEGSSIIKNSSIGKNCKLKLGSYINEAILEDNVGIGPFAQIRPNSILKSDVNIGNFVELKNAQLDKGVKANHLSYLGDCEIGEGSNIGAGTITCNYDGIKKSRTKIGKGVFVGSNSALVAPVVVGDEAVIGAGSVITKEVEAGSLAITRAPQVSKAGWAKKRKK